MLPIKSARLLFAILASCILTSCDAPPALPTLYYDVTAHVDVGSGLSPSSKIAFEISDSTPIEDRKELVKYLPPAKTRGLNVVDRADADYLIMVEFYIASKTSKDQPYYSLYGIRGKAYRLAAHGATIISPHVWEGEVIGHGSSYKKIWVSVDGVVDLFETYIGSEYVGQSKPNQSSQPPRMTGG